MAAAAETSAPAPTASSAPPATASSGAAASGKTAAIRQQVEFYFGDANFRRDKFMRDEAAKDAQGCELHCVHLPFS